MVGHSPQHVGPAMLFEARQVQIELWHFQTVDRLAQGLDLSERIIAEKAQRQVQMISWNQSGAAATARLHRNRRQRITQCFRWQQRKE